MLRSQSEVRRFKTQFKELTDIELQMLEKRWMKDPSAKADELKLLRAELRQRKLDED